MIDHGLVDPVDNLDHADDAEATEEAYRAAYCPDLVYEWDLDVPLHIGHGRFSYLDGDLRNVSLHLGSNSIVLIWAQN